MKRKRECLAFWSLKETDWWKNAEERGEIIKVYDHACMETRRSPNSEFLASRISICGVNTDKWLDWNSANLQALQLAPRNRFKSKDSTAVRSP